MEACRKLEQEEVETLRKLKKPELDDELANHFIGRSALRQSAGSLN